MRMPGALMWANRQGRVPIRPTIYRKPPTGSRGCLAENASSSLETEVVGTVLKKGFHHAAESQQLRTRTADAGEKRER